MRPFRFRADAALQLRRREHDQALVHLARAQTALAAAEHAVAGALDAMRAAAEGLATAMRAPAGNAPIEWYRSWRVRCAAEHDVLVRRRSEREGDVERAARAVTVTHKRVRSLELLHDNALAAWHRDAAAEERKTMDALAGSRFIQRKECV
jgi:flagellar biosynthesis chaperone FliJ